MDQIDLLKRFKYHAPTPAKIEIHNAIRESCLSLAEFLNVILPEGREKSTTITKLEEVMYWANAAVARQGDREL